MLHAIVLESGDQREIEFLERIINPRIVFEPYKSISMGCEYHINIARNFVRIRFAMKHCHLTAINGSGDFLKLASHK